MGHDTGAVSVGYHMLNSGNEWIRSQRRFILISSSPFRPFRSNIGRGAQSNLRNLTSMAGCTNVSLPQQMLRCLRHRSAREVMVAATQVKGDFPGPVFTPSFNTEPLTLPPTFLARIFPLKGKEVLLGDVLEEGHYEVDLLLNSPEKDPHTAVQALEPRLRRFLGDLHRTGNFREDVIDHYTHLWESDDPVATLDMWRRALGDISFLCPLRYWAEYLSTSNVVYMFRLASMTSRRKREDWHPNRNNVLELFFGRPLVTDALTDDTDLQGMSQTIMYAWTYFAKSGRLPAISADMQWPRYPSMLEMVGKDSVPLPGKTSVNCGMLRPFLYPNVTGPTNSTTAYIKQNVEKNATRLVAFLHSMLGFLWLAEVNARKHGGKLVTTI